jgi:hypothetical protein
MFYDIEGNVLLLFSSAHLLENTERCYGNYSCSYGCVRLPQQLKWCASIAEFWKPPESSFQIFSYMCVL